MDLSALRDFHFLRPAWLLALPLLLGLALWLARRRGGEGGWARLIDPELFASLRLEGAAAAGGLSPWPWLALAWTAATLALAGPSWQHDVSTGFRAPAAWVLVLDLSPSMSASDVQPDRATRARYALDDILGAARDARVGLVAFSGEPYTVTPLTDDVATVRALLPPLTPDIMPAGGDNMAPALQQAAQLLSRAGAREQRVIVVSDGFTDPAAAFSAAQQLKAGGATLSVIGVGTSGGAPLSQAGGGFAQDMRGGLVMTHLDEGRLKELAAAGGGDYVTLAELPKLIASLQTHGERAEGATARQDIRIEHWRDGGIWLLPILLLLGAFLSRRGWL